MSEVQSTTDSPTRSHESNNAGMPATRATIMLKLADTNVAVRDRAWRTFCDLYCPVMYRFALHKRLSAADAEEVVANVLRNLVVATQRGFAVDASIGRFRDYLRTIVNREIGAQSQRAASGHQSGVDMESVEHASDAARDEWRHIERQEHVNACLERLFARTDLSPRDLEAFRRYALQGESAKQVAKSLGVSVARVYAIKSETIAALRKESDGLDELMGES